MKHPLRYRLAIAFFILYLIAVTWPVAQWVASPTPFVLGLPLSLAWSIGWIIAGFLVLVILEWLRERS